MASVLAKEIVDKWYPGQAGDTLPNIIDTHLAPVREALSDTNRCIAHELYPATIDKVRLALASLDPKGDKP